MTAKAPKRKQGDPDEPLTACDAVSRMGPYLKALLKMGLNREDILERIGCAIDAFLDEEKTEVRNGYVSRLQDSLPRISWRRG